MNNSIIKSSKPGKLILLGEYAVLEQAPCVVAAVNKNCTVQIEPSSGPVFHLEASNREISDVEFVINDQYEIDFKSNITDADRQRLRFVTAVLTNIAKEQAGEIQPAVISIGTKNFYHPDSGDKLGLGASAAITVTLLSALKEYVGEPLTGRSLYREAFPIHKEAQGKLGSGSDIAASAVEGVIKYTVPQNSADLPDAIEPLSWPDDLQVIPVWAGKSASTQDLVQQVRIYREQEPTSYHNIMEPMIELSKEGCAAFQSGDIEALLDIIPDYALLEQKLGEASQTDIVSNVHRQIAKVVHEAGGSYKPSGAGSGDMGVAFCNGVESKMKVQNALQKSSFDIIDLALQTEIATIGV